MASVYAESTDTENDNESDRGGFITVNQVAELLHVHPHSVRRWADAGLLPCYRFGARRDRRFAVNEVAEFLEVHAKGKLMSPKVT